VSATPPDVRVLTLAVHHDARGALFEVGSEARREALALPPLVHDVVSVSRRGVLRGLHLQDPGPQGKLVTVLHGRVWDVAVDARAGSPTLGRWHGLELVATPPPSAWSQVWIPPGLAHGFLALSDDAVVLYRCTAPYDPAAQHTLRWDDPALAIPWPLEGPPILSDKDANAPTLAAWLASRR